MRAFLFVLVGCFVSSCTSSQIIENEVKRPAVEKSGRPVGETKVIGSYVSGCISGAVELPVSKGQYLIANRNQNRHFGHPELISFIDNLSDEVRTKNLGALVIGDMAKPHGGPMPDRHSSHQTGLDVDIWFMRVESSRLMATSELEFDEPPTYLENDGSLNEQIWGPDDELVLKLAAQKDEVSRIFVNVKVKEQLCESYSGEKWLRKIRPWYGHDDHFHVRLNCPPKSSTCVPQANLSNDLGCSSSDLKAWSLKQKEDLLKHTPKKRVFRGTLPLSCVALLRKNSRSL